MKIAIHEFGEFSTRWIQYCLKNNIEYKIVNVYDSEIVNQLSDCDAFMWQHYHMSYKDALFAKQLLYSLEIAKVRVFPDFNTTWHFDDKVGQKYLLEAIGAPLVKSHVFYDKKTANNWLSNATYPLVSKLRGGAGATNVKLIKNKNEATKHINKSFGSGFKYYDPIVYFNDSFRLFRAGKQSLIFVLKSLVRFLIPTKFSKMYHKEKGYVYFQEFVKNNSFDIRIVVVADKAFGIKRLNRDNDFRASGSGKLIYKKDEIDERCVKIAFDVNEKINCQSIAYDFVFDEKSNPLIVEISYSFSVGGYDDCEGYWDKELNWYAGKFNPYGWMVELVKNKK